MNCPAPGANQYVAAICSSGNYQVRSCSTPAAGQFTTTACVSGSPNTLGADTIIQSCSSPAAGSFVTAACVAGSASMLGTNTVTSTCAQPMSGSYAMAACVAGNATAPGTNTSIAACTTPGSGQFTTTVCVAGSSSMAGTASVVVNCTPPASGEYVATACVPGSASMAGTDTVRTPCGAPGSGQFTSTTCTSGDVATIGANTAFTPCAAPGSGQFTQTACVSGSATQLGSDSTFASCGIPGAGAYVSAICVQGTNTSAGTNTTSTVCSTPAPGQYISTACVPGSATMLGTDATITACTAIAQCTSSLTCTTSTNSVCTACAPGYALNMGGTVCALIPVCGNGIVQSGEGCDDGNTNAADGCSARCQVETPYSCSSGSPSVCTSTVEINCNDGVDNDLDGLSDCADPNCGLGCDVNFGACPAGQPLLVYTSTDVPKAIPDVNPVGATSTLTVGSVGIVSRLAFQANLTHTFDADLTLRLLTPSTAVIAAAAVGNSGDNFTNTIFNDACATAIASGTPPFTGCFRPQNPLTGFVGKPSLGQWAFKVVDSASADIGSITGFGLALCAAPSTCGDGVRDATEGCDDANSVSGDGCSLVCAVESGFSCSGDPSICINVCGNGVRDPSETCDDGNTTNGDGCSSTCNPEPGYTCMSAGPGSCTGVCGDGRIVNGEQCDDGNTSSNDACSATCTWEVLPEIEPNGTMADADTNAGVSGYLIDRNRNFTGDIVAGGDLDLYKVVITSPTVVRSELFGPSGTDCVGFATMSMQLLDNTGATLKNEAFAGSGIGGCSALVAPLDPGTYYLRISRSVAGVQLGYFLQVRFVVPQEVEAEPNDNTATANAITSRYEYVINGDHSVATDADFFAITVAAGMSLRLEVVEGDNTETCESNGVDSTLTLMNSAGTTIGSDGDNGRGFCSLIDGTGSTPANAFAHNLAAGTYFVRVTSFSTAATSPNQFRYRLLVTVRNP